MVIDFVFCVFIFLSSSFGSSSGISSSSSSSSFSSGSSSGVSSSSGSSSLRSSSGFSQDFSSSFGSSSIFSSSGSLTSSSRSSMSSFFISCNNIFALSDIEVSSYAGKFTQDTSYSPAIRLIVRYIPSSLCSHVSAVSSSGSNENANEH